MTITTLNFVSIGFTLKVWRNWTRGKILQFNNKFDINQQIELGRGYWVFGSARSGTTWLMEVLQRGFNLHSVFEPTGHQNSNFPKSELDKEPAIATRLSDLGIPERWVIEVVSGRFANNAIDRSNSVFAFRKRAGVVLKDVDYRQLQISAWTSLHEQIQPVIILRQPINVLKSQITAHKAWKHEHGFRGEYLAELESLNRELLSPAALRSLAGASELLKTTDYRQVAIAKWCIENLISLETQSENPRLKTVVYERMVAPKKEARAYLESIFGAFTHNPKLRKRSRMDIGQEPGTAREIEQQTAAMLAVFGLQPFTEPNQPHLLDLEALIAEYLKPASNRLTPKFLR